MPSLKLTTVLFLLSGSARCIPHHSKPSPSADCSTSAEPDTPTSTSLPPISTPKTVSSVPTVTTSSGATSTGSATSASSSPDGFEPGVKWQIAIQDPVDIRGGMQPADAKVVDIDLFFASMDPTLIPALHDAGATVICYFNAGAVQVTDCDWPQWDSEGLFDGEEVENYDQERYVDITNDEVVTLHKARIDLAHSIGCDGIDPDNIDTYGLDGDDTIGKQITEQNMVDFLSTLASYAHGKTTTLGHPLMIGQKNAPEITHRIHAFMDFAVSENCVGSDDDDDDSDEFCSIFQQYYANSGKPIFDIEYPSSLISGDSSKRRSDSLDIETSSVGCSAGASSDDMEVSCGMSSTSNNTGISRILKLDDTDYGLNGCTQYCTSTTSFVMPAYESNSTNSCCFGSSC